MMTSPSVLAATVEPMVAVARRDHRRERGCRRGSPAGPAAVRPGPAAGGRSCPCRGPPPGVPVGRRGEAGQRVLEDRQQAVEEQRDQRRRGAEAERAAPRAPAPPPAGRSGRYWRALRRQRQELARRTAGSTRMARPTATRRRGQRSRRPRCSRWLSVEGRAAASGCRSAGLSPGAKRPEQRREGFRLDQEGDQAARGAGSPDARDPAHAARRASARRGPRSVTRPRIAPSPADRQRRRGRDQSSSA